MKKIYYLLAFIAVAITFASCDPMSKTYKTLDAQPAAAKSLNYTLVPADYKLLPTTSSDYKYGDFTSLADATATIPTILNIKFFDYGNGSNINVTYASGTNVILADSVFADVAYTMVAADYTASASVTGTTFKDYSSAQVLLYLTYKYPTPVANQLSVLTYTYYSSGLTPSAGVLQTDSFLFINGTWKKIYTITPAQYASIGHGSYNQFVVGDAANLQSYFNTFLKNDVNVASTAKVGDVQYVSYNYYNATGKVTSQRVMLLSYDGNNWTINNTLPFAKLNGTWIPDPTIYHTLTTADTKLIGDPAGTKNQSLGTLAQRANLYQYGDFSGWAAIDLQNAMIFVLTNDFPAPKVNIPYKVTYLVYSGTDVPTTATFIYNGTAWAPYTP
jgi:hypothetical protein